MLDPEYLRLYRQYAKSMQAFEIVVKKRSEHRARWMASQGMSPAQRRPVGASPAPGVSRISSGGTPLAPRKATKGIYLGDILGWAKIIGDSSPVEEGADPTADFSASVIFDKVQLELYWNAKLHYEKCRKEYFDYVRRGLAGDYKNLSSPYQGNLRQAKGYLRTAAEMQWQGVDDAAADAEIRKAELEVESACSKIWEIYLKNPEKKITRLMLLEGLVDAQLVGIDDSPIVQKMMDELQRILSALGG